MRGLTTIRQKSNKKKRKLRNTSNTSTTSSSGASQEQRVLRSKLNNPLYNCPQVTTTTTHEASSDVVDRNDDNIHNDTHDDDHNNNNNNHRQQQQQQQQQPNLDKVYANSSILGESKLSGRREWKLKHKKGAFNPKIMKRNTHRTPGSFIKSKNYK